MKLTTNNIIALSIFFMFAVAPIFADEIKHKFGNPSFSKQGQGAHYLTIENQEFSRKEQIEDALESARKSAEREADNTTLAKFIRNLESRIYAQMAKQLVESMFQNDNPVRFGSFVLEGSTITYEVITRDNGEEYIKLTIIGEDGTETILEVPVGAGNFGSDYGRETPDDDGGGGDG